MLVLVDQFEELFRFRRSEQIENSRDEAVAFVRCCSTPRNSTTLPIYVVLTMRSDFIGDCMDFPACRMRSTAACTWCGRMTRDGLRAAITGPVAVAGGRIAPRLVQRLLNDIGRRPGSAAASLQHALMRTWEHWAGPAEPATPIDIDDYEAIGGLRDALSRHAEEAYAEATRPGGAAVVERMFKALTDTVRRSARRPPADVDRASSRRSARRRKATWSQVVEIFRPAGP